MKRILALCLLWAASASWPPLYAAPAEPSVPPVPTVKVWRVGNTVIDVSRCPKGFCLISSGCLTEAGKTCQALHVMNNRVQADSGPGGTNPGSGVCQQRLQGQVFVARDQAGNEQSFCRFADGSFLSSDGLWRW
jgi:hypothetical protein